NNTLLATHEYLVSEKKQKGAVRHESYIKQHNTRSRQTEKREIRSWMTGTEEWTMTEE
ncbi:4889_t:CDS:1, partial [Ambispora gerdemannii]